MKAHVTKQVAVTMPGNMAQLKSAWLAQQATIERLTVENERMRQICLEEAEKQINDVLYHEGGKTFCRCGNIILYACLYLGFARRTAVKIKNFSMKAFRTWQNANEEDEVTGDVYGDEYIEFKLQEAGWPVFSVNDKNEVI